jgi:transposase
MSKNGIRYSEEFKQQIVDFYQAGSSVTYLSREYGVANVTIYKWIKELSNVKVSDSETMSVKEYEKMKKRIAELEMENEILKKATAIFARKR